MNGPTLNLFNSADKQIDKSKKIQFLIVINPSKRISEDTRAFKEEFYQYFGSFPSRKSEPHITIASIICWPNHQYKVISFVKKDHPGTGNFLVTINGFAPYEGNGNKVIHLKVEGSKEFKMLNEYYNQKKMEIHRYKKKFYVSETPHITIARNLGRNVFEEAKRVYLPKSYQGTFVAKSLTILRRELSERSATKYEEFDEIPI